MCIINYVLNTDFKIKDFSYLQKTSSGLIYFLSILFKKCKAIQCKQFISKSTSWVGFFAGSILEKFKLKDYTCTLNFIF